VSGPAAILKQLSRSNTKVKFHQNLFTTKFCGWP